MQDASTLVASLFCELHIVRITLQDSNPSPPALPLRKSADGWGQSWNLGDMAIYCLITCFRTCNVKTQLEKGREIFYLLLYLNEELRDSSIIVDNWIMSI